jgi:hypothetical protein
MSGTGTVTVHSGAVAQEFELPNSVNSYAHARRRRRDRCRYLEYPEKPEARSLLSSSEILGIQIADRALTQTQSYPNHLSGGIFVLK